MNTEFYIEGYRVDISADISSLLTYAIDDIKDFATRQTTFSKTIVLPGTANNNALFGNIFETGHSNSYDAAQNNIGYNFNAAKSARAILFQDNLQTFKGTVRLLEIIKDSGRIEYEVALNGELTGLNVALSKGLLTDLDFSAYNHTFHTNDILPSWDNPGGSGYYYPLIDYGGYSTNKHDWEIFTLRPALYVKEYIDKMFAAANYRYDCTLFNTTRFKKLIVPHNKKQLTKLIEYSFRVTAVTHTYDGVTDPLTFIEFPNHIIRTDFGGNVDNTEWTATANITGSFKARIVGSYVKSTSGSVLTFNLKKNGVTVASNTLGAGTTSGSFDFTLTNNTVISSGDIMSVEFDAPPTVDVTISNQTNMTNYQETYVPITYNDPVIIADVIPMNIRQVDFLSSIVKLFNLYVYEDKFEDNLIKITPYIDFFSTESQNAVDWTYKLNRDKTVRIKPMSELNSKIYEFNYKEDSDYFNSEYKKRYNQGYGSYIFDSEFEFTSQTNKLDLIFAPTPLVGYSGEEKVYSTIFKKSGTTEESIDSVIRILQTKKITGVSSWDIKNNGSIVTSPTDYPYAGHFDDPDNPTNDLNFGVLKELFFTLVTGDLTVTQFNVYWSSYMAEITDKDSKLLTANFYLTPKDIFELDFSKYIHVDGVIFRLNKISDYNATAPSDCEVQLIKVINTIY